MTISRWIYLLNPGFIEGIDATQLRNCEVRFVENRILSCEMQIFI
jgi:hypothetical protein